MLVARRPRTLIGLAPLVVLIGSASATRQPAYRPPASIFDPRLTEVRRASAGWDLRGGPPREVVDQVCLVPDAATFYEALATWDDRHFFPILIDDVDLALKFVRAFRPARVVRYPGRGKPIEDAGKGWERAVIAVGESWARPEAPESSGPRGDRRPTALGQTPPGVVVGRPESPALPGLAALAAGRFQPLLRFETPLKYAEALAPEALKGFVDGLEAVVREAVPDCGAIGDDCDFLTVAGDYPFRYGGPKGSMSVDDRLARRDDSRRWAFAGRLLGDDRRSVYAAMCSLFLQPETALTFNSYAEDGAPWADYSTRPAANELRSVLPTTIVTGEREASAVGWHETFRPANRHGLVFLNSSGSPTVFNLRGGPGHSLDVMPSVPTAVCMIHSYSAAEPSDPNTIAGHWLAQGAFLYHGAMDEPWLQSFRPPGLVADLLTRGIPFAAALRPLMTEPWGEPWKLVVLGDPLYHLNRGGRDPRRVADFAATAAWIPYLESPPPGPSSPGATRLAWAVGTALVRQTAAAPTDDADDLLAVLREIDRTALNPAARRILDELGVVLLFRAKRLEEARAFARAIPPAERSPVVLRLAASATLAEFQLALQRHDFARAAPYWSDLVRVDTDVEFRNVVTSRLAAIADNPLRRGEWRNRLKMTLGRPGYEVATPTITAELKRIEGVIAADPER